jgi:hypothetical protein
MSRTAAELLTNVAFDCVDADDLVLDAVVMLRVASTTGDGKPRLVMQTTPDLDWILHVGMLKVGLHIAIHDIEADHQHEDDD